MSNPYQAMPGGLTTYSNPGASSGTTFMSPSDYSAPFSTSFPTTGTYVPGYSIGDFPRSMADGIRPASVASAKQTSQRCEVMNVSLGVWPDDLPYHQEIFPGQLLFIANLNTGVPTTKSYMLNIRHVNTILSDGYNEFLRIYTRKIDRITGKPIVGSSIAEGSKIISSGDYDILLRTPTVQWNSLRFLQDIMQDPTKEAGHCIRYAYKEGIEHRFTPIGYNRGKLDPNLDAMQIDVSVKGNIDDTENIWGDTLRAKDRLYVTFMPRTTFVGTSGFPSDAFAFVPMATLAEEPDQEETTYFDVTGHKRYGTPYFIGYAEKWSEPQIKLNPSYIQQSIGLIPMIDRRCDIRPEPLCISILLKRPVDTPFKQRF